MLRSGPPDRYQVRKWWSYSLFSCGFSLSRPSREGKSSVFEEDISTAMVFHLQYGMTVMIVHDVVLKALLRARY